MMNNDQFGLDGVFEQYRAACPDVEPSAQFMPALWKKIEARRSFWWVFQGLARTAMAGCAALALLLLGLNLAGPEHANLSPSYADALVAEHSAEKTYYAEAVRPTPLTDDDSPDGLSH
jgi:hypothetical protein